MEAESIAERWKFPWSVLDVLIGGKSSIDLKELETPTVEQASDFLKSYGFDHNNDQDRKKMHAIMIESIHFISSYLMPKEWKLGNRPPKELLECIDVRKILVWASSKDNKSGRLRAWSCAILKVMHTITHIDDVQRMSNLHTARQQVMDRFKKVIFRNNQGHLFFGDKDNHIALEKVEWKHCKPRNSIILKLLHKPGNVAETIYDLIGIRIITKHLNETMIAVKYLRQFYLVDFPNTYPSRARNNLIDHEKFHIHVETLRQMLISGQLSPKDFQNTISNLDISKTPKKTINPHSASSYRSIQLTCRHRVRYQSSLQTWLDKVNQAAQQNHLSSSQEQLFTAITNFAEKELHQSKTDLAIYFPFEVQILDKEAAESIESGAASHDRYKKSQIRTARRRILSEVLHLPSRD